MANLNRIILVLVEKGKNGKWLAEEIVKRLVPQANGAVILFNHTCSH